AVHAQAKAEKRVIKARHRHPLKNKSVYKYVLKKIRLGWSPEQISGRLKFIKPDRVSIHDRPEEIENREVFGHWESDSIVGKNHIGGIHTEVERKTRFIMARFINDLTAKETADKASKMFGDLPRQAKKSTTLDNGSENVEHKQFDLDTYFCDPYSSWQRATNKNSNGLIRRYLPMGTR
ncbi:IS30 family transposase, partial [Patescibacteria group bacterium]|nr:IS30 family transposase [Patescibacteria group bacterium]